jgi:hypothetical protein
MYGRYPAPCYSHTLQHGYVQARKSVFKTATLMRNRVMGAFNLIADCKESARARCTIYRNLNDHNMQSVPHPALPPWENPDRR